MSDSNRGMRLTISRRDRDFDCFNLAHLYFEGKFQRYRILCVEESPEVNSAIALAASHARQYGADHDVRYIGDLGYCAQSWDGILPSHT